MIQPRRKCNIHNTISKRSVDSERSFDVARISLKKYDIGIDRTSEGRERRVQGNKRAEMKTMNGKKPIDSPLADCFRGKIAARVVKSTTRINDGKCP